MTNHAFQNGKMVYILDTKNNDAFVMMPDAYMPYVFAHGYTIDERKNISWAYGNYYNDLEDATKAFYKDSYRIYLRHWQFVKNMNQDDIFCYGVATAEDGNFKVEFEDDEQRKNYTDLFGEG